MFDALCGSPETGVTLAGSAGTMVDWPEHAVANSNSEALENMTKLRNNLNKYSSSQK
jgi:hypothetical protein